jgi:hypothetical protein
MSWEGRLTMTLKKLDSVTGILPMASNSQDGSLHIATGVATLDPTMSLMALDTLKKRSPSDTNKHLLSSLEQQGLCLEPNIDRNYEINDYLIRCDQHEELDFLLADGLEKIAYAMVPLPIEDMEKSLLTSMMLMTKSPGETPEDCALRCQLYANQMQHWPADIFIAVLDIVVRNHKWWPAFSDFEREYQWMIKPRIRMREALQKCMNKLD